MRVGGAIMGGQILGVVVLAILLSLGTILATSALPEAMERASQTNPTAAITRYLFVIITTAWALICLVLAVSAPVALGALFARGHLIIAGVLGLVIMLIGIMLAGVVDDFSDRAHLAVGGDNVGVVTPGASCPASDVAVSTAAADDSLICIGSTSVAKINDLDGAGTSASAGAVITGSKTFGTAATITAYATTIHGELIISRTVLQFIDVLYVLGLVVALFMAIGSLGMAGVNMYRGASGAMGGMGMRR